MATLEPAGGFSNEASAARVETEKDKRASRRKVEVRRTFMGAPENEKGCSSVYFT
jgi:hypothetical protein